jgi:hypothetical protein
MVNIYGYMLLWIILWISIKVHGRVWMLRYKYKFNVKGNC